MQAAVTNLFIRGSVIRYIEMDPARVDFPLLEVRRCDHRTESAHSACRMRLEEVCISLLRQPQADARQRTLAPERMRDDLLIASPFVRPLVHYTLHGIDLLDAADFLDSECIFDVSSIPHAARRSVASKLKSSEVFGQQLAS